ncbi:hypothetical protein, partial [Salmonella enterica]
TLAMLQQGQRPGPLWLLLVLAVCAAGMQAAQLLRAGQAALLPRTLLGTLGVPLAIAALVWWAAPQQFALPVQVLLTL